MVFGTEEVKSDGETRGGRGRSGTRGGGGEKERKISKASKGGGERLAEGKCAAARR